MKSFTGNIQGFGVNFNKLNLELNSNAKILFLIELYERAFACLSHFIQHSIC